jgi:hypothetical protein
MNFYHNIWLIHGCGGGWYLTIGAERPFFYA